MGRAKQNPNQTRKTGIRASKQGKKKRKQKETKKEMNVMVMVMPP